MFADRGDRVKLTLKPGAYWFAVASGAKDDRCPWRDAGFSKTCSRTSTYEPT